MPNSAQTNPTITYTDDHLKTLHQNVATNLKAAGAKVPYQAVKPIHVPDEQPKNIIDEDKIDTERSVPESFKSTPETSLTPLKALSEHLDYADQIVTGRSHVVDEAQRFTAFKNEKEEKRMQFASTPKTEHKTPVKKFVDWLHR